MAEGKHTPGPWIATAYGDKFSDDKEPVFWLIDAVGGHNTEKCVAEIGHTAGCDPEIEKANAHLIAAAPDLVSALQALGVLPDGYCFCFNSSRDASRPEHEHTGECRAARAALAKARGETP